MSIGIINKLDTPWIFTTHLQQDKWHIKYSELTEICQGGPLVGNLIVNEQKSFLINPLEAHCYILIIL